jgi:hypothetical protein
MTLEALSVHLRQQDISDAQARRLFLDRLIWDSIPGLDDLEKYSPDQPRHPAGTSEGGRFASVGDSPEEAEKFQTERLIRDGPGEGSSRVRVVNHPGIGLWGSSHHESSTITGYSAQRMMIDGYRDLGASERAQNLAEKFLSVIAEGRGAGEKLYHGFTNSQRIDWKPGDTLKLPLSASTGDLTDAAGYGISYNRDDNSLATIFEFPEHTAMAGYSRWDRENTKDFGHTWAEAIVAGEFRVRGTRTAHEGGWKKLPVTVVELEPVSLFDPETRRYRKL